MHYNQFPQTNPERTAGNETTNDNTLSEVCLSDLIRNERSQIRKRLDQSTVRRYGDAMRSGAELPPISIAVVDGAPFLIDGWHRVAAAESIGRLELPAFVLNAPPEQHAWLAARENMKNGLPLRRDEALAVFKAYVRAGQHLKGRKRLKSSREIAADLNGIRSHATILKWMGKYFPRIRGMMRNENDAQYDGTAPSTNEPSDHESSMIAETLGHLEEARKLSRGVRDPLKRGEMIAEAEAIVAAMKAQADWTPPEPSDF